MEKVESVEANSVVMSVYAMAPHDSEQAFLRSPPIFCPFGPPVSASPLTVSLLLNHACWHVNRLYFFHLKKTNTGRGWEMESMVNGCPVPLDRSNV